LDSQGRPEMESAEKKKAQHAQPILLYRQSKRPPRKKGRRRMEAGEDEGRKENRRRGAGGAWTTDVSRQSTRGSEVGEVGVEMGQQRR
jgi:hypothetical protein